MKSNNSRRLSVLLITFSLLYNSCTLIGLGVGAMVDSAGPTPDNKIVAREDYETIKRTKRITIQLKDNLLKVGKFEEITEHYLILRTAGMSPKGKIEKISFDEILSVEIHPNKNGRGIGLVIGLALDLAITTWLGNKN